MDCIMWIFYWLVTCEQNESGAEIPSPVEAHHFGFHISVWSLVQFFDASDLVGGGGGALEVDVISDTVHVRSHHKSTFNEYIQYRRSQHQWVHTISWKCILSQSRDVTSGLKTCKEHESYAGHPGTQKGQRTAPFQSSRTQRILPLKRSSLINFGYP